MLDLDPLELAAGVPLGVDSSAPELPPATSKMTARAALEQEVLGALARPPCIVSFSGGRDSSAMLALATMVARREGMPEPIALSWRFPGVRSTDESDWQELVIAYLGLHDWERLSFGDELEVLGETATATLRAHGLLWPATCHLQLPAIERARGGSLLVAHDGRGVLEGWPFARAQAVLHGRARPEPQDALRVGAALTPMPLRRRVGAARVGSHFPWLREAARRALIGRVGGPLAQPGRWDRRIAWHARLRVVRLAVQSVAILARAHDVAACHPLLGPSFLAALAREGGATGLGGRVELTRRLFGELLPYPVLSRRGTTSELAPVLWARRSRRFAKTWDGRGLDHSLVDVDCLRAIWTGEHPWLHASTIAQAAWLTAACG